MWLLALILFFLKHSFTQTAPLYLRKTTLSYKYMQSKILMHGYDMNQQGGNWSYSLDFQLQRPS